MSIKIFTLLLIIFTYLTIRGKYTPKKRLHYIFKPLTTLLIIYFAFIAKINSTGLYGDLIFWGLILSLFGDVFIMLPKQKFKEGLFSFLAAHILYIAAFWQGVDKINLISIIPFLIFAAGYFYLTYNSYGKYFLPVLFYIFVITIMGISALNRLIELTNQMSILILIGSLLFMVSDSVLAWNKFKKEFKSAEVIILSSYFAAQYLFALSILFLAY
jgi:uncharacterized membrane protein YhhN